jgi:hypothetical protein
VTDTTLIENFPAGKLPEARAALAAVHTRLVKAASKAGAATPDAPVLNVVAERTVARCTSCRQLAPVTKLGDGGVGMCGLDTPETALCLGMVVGHKVVDLEISIGRPALAGWEFLAVIEPMTNGNLVKRVPGSDTAFDLTSFRTGDAFSCDHCNTVRNRTETFVVKADGTDILVDAGTVKKVGRNCLEVFLGGKSASAILARLGFADLVRSVADSDGEGGGGRPAPPTYAPLEVLEWTVSVVKADGWVSKKVASETDKEATATTVAYLLTPPWSFKEYNDWKTSRDKLRPTDDDKVKAAAVMSWTLALEGKSDYEYSLKLLASEEVVTTSKFGFLCSAVAGYERHLGFEVARRKVATTSKHVGTVGEKLVVTVTVEKVIDLEGQYGVTHLHKMVDEAGNVVTWKASNERLDVGKTLTLLGTVKSHGEFKGVAETVLTRCKEVEPGTVVKASKAKKPKVTVVKTGRPVEETEESYAEGCRWVAIRDEKGY